MSEEVSRVFGKPALAPALVRKVIGELIERSLELVPEDGRVAAAGEIARALDTLEASIGPAMPGELILSRGAAEEELRRVLRAAVDDLGRQWSDDRESRDKP